MNPLIYLVVLCVGWLPTEVWGTQTELCFWSLLLQHGWKLTKCDIPVETFTHACMSYHCEGKHSWERWEFWLKSHLKFGWLTLFWGRIITTSRLQWVSDLWIQDGDSHFQPWRKWHQHTSFIFSRPFRLYRVSTSPQGPLWCSLYLLYLSRL